MVAQFQIPVIDFGLFVKGDATTRQAIARQIHQTCHDVGFMYLRNFGIEQRLIDQIFVQSQQFFALPFEVKNQLSQSYPIAWSLHSGYVGMNREHEDPNQPFDLKEAFDIFRADSYYQGAFTPSAITPKTWLPVQELHRIAIEFFETCSSATYQILQAFALSLQLTENFFAPQHGQNNILRLLHYPALTQKPEPGQLRAGVHTDYGSITLLFQDDLGRLEIYTVDEEWIAAPPMPGTVVVNIGDLMQLWTNKEFRSTRHRVMLPTGQNTRCSRYLIAFFCEPNNDAEVACIESCQGLEHPRVYTPVLAGEHLRRRDQANIEAFAASRQYGSVKL